MITCPFFTDSKFSVHLCSRVASALALLYICHTTSLHADIKYTVQYVGVENSTLKGALKSSTQLSTLKNHPPDSLSALRYRAESDMATVLQVMHSWGYLEAKVAVRIEGGIDAETATVIVIVDEGPAYLLSTFDIVYTPSEQSPPPLSLSQIGITLNKPLSAKKEIEAEEKILSFLSDSGYPLASVNHREIIADGESKTIKVRLQIKTGPKCTFGPLSIGGNETVKRKYFENKLGWKEGKSFRSSLVDATEKVLADSSLFSSILITHADTVADNNCLPMHIEVVESKHKSVNLGVSYQTYYGPGLTFGWENRNLAQMGQRLSVKGDITRRSHSGQVTYLYPDFHRKKQDFVIQAQAMHEDILPYSERTYNIAPRIERRIGKKVRISFGGKGERLFVTASVHNGAYWLIESPLYFGYSGADSLLNPTTGIAFDFSFTPTINVQNRQDSFMQSVFTVSGYLPVRRSKAFVIAQKITLGSIWSKTVASVPVAKRFFGGSEEDLRGYAYQSVSPIANHHKPIGGRSEIFYTIESRFRVSKAIGLVPFLDMGNVYSPILPTFSGKWLKSAGLGLRYFSFMGPFRLDVGFPLNKRKGIDKFTRILVSIGQTF